MKSQEQKIFSLFGDFAVFQPLLHTGCAFFTAAVAVGLTSSANVANGMITSLFRGGHWAMAPSLADHDH